METLQRILADHPFARGLNDCHLELLVGCASNIRFEAGQVVFREGEEANQFYLIREGKMALELFAAERGPINILTLGEGEMLGWSWLVPPYRWRFDARAIELTRAIALDGKCLREKSERDHDLGYELLKRIAHTMEERLQATRLQLLNVYEVHT
jgi:CRP/FNR family transcriptional regulator, cyclic AMP receptor protein